MLIQEGLLFGLGFCVATILALLCLPAVWSRAMRLTRHRLERLVPLSESEIAAAWDGLRATAAVEQRRLEQRIESGAGRLAEARADLGRRTVELTSVEIAKQDVETELSALRGDFATLEADRTATEGQRAALQLGFDQQTLELDAVDEERLRLGARAAASELMSERQRAVIAGLETQKEGHLARISHLQTDLHRLRGVESELRTAQGVLERERDAARNEVMIAAAQRSVLDLKLKDLGDELAEVQRRYESKTAAFARAEEEIMDQKEGLERSSAALEALRKRFAELEIRLMNPPDTDPVTGMADFAPLRGSIADLADEALATLEPKGDGKPLEFGRA